MKTILYTVCFLVGLGVAWAHGGEYARMKKDLDAYRPHLSYPLPPVSRDRQAGETGRETRHEKVAPQMIGQLPGRDRLPAPDAGADLIFFQGTEERFRALAQIASDPVSAMAHIREKLVLDEVRIMALLRNPTVQAARKKVLAERQSFDQITALNDRLRQYAAFTSAVSSQAGPLLSGGAPGPAYPFPGLSALQGKMVKEQVFTLTQQELIAQKQVISDMDSAFHDLVFIQQSIQVIKETLDAFSRLETVATSLYTSGRTSFQDVIKVKIRIQTLEEELITLNTRTKNLQIRILELLDLPWDVRVGPPVPVPVPENIPGPEDLFALARQHRQELAVIRSQINRVSAMVEMAETMMEAPFHLGLSLSQNDFINTAGTDAPKQAFAEKTMAAMANNSPVRPWYGINGPWLNQTRQTLSALKHTLAAQENATDRLVRNAWFEVDKNRREYTRYKERIMPLAASALEVSAKEYEAGSIPFSQAMDSYTFWLNVQLAIAEKKAALGKSVADLEAVVGTKLEPPPGV